MALEDVIHRHARPEAGLSGQLSTRGWDGYIAEVVYLNGASADDLLKIEGDLMRKGGLGHLLPGDHPYKNEAPQSQIPESGTAEGSASSRLLSRFDLKRACGPIRALRWLRMLGGFSSAHRRRA